ncbi:MAG: hypothetical protein OHK0039_23370 [Bacteroidia bacterium]
MIRHIQNILLLTGFTCLLLFSSSACKPRECVPSSSQIQACHSDGGEFDYELCTCHY